MAVALKSNEKTLQRCDTWLLALLGFTKVSYLAFEAVCPCSVCVDAACSRWLPSASCFCQVLWKADARLAACTDVDDVG